jgi:hypothetical protein
MTRQEFSQFVNGPRFFSIGSIVALVCWAMGWIRFEYLLICLGAAIVGTVLHYKKKSAATEHTTEETKK